MMTSNVVLFIGCMYALVSVVTLAVYGWDKRQASRDKWRVKERTLHLLELLGGWPGALVARTLFHHKRRKLGFSFVTALIVLLHLAIWCGAYLIYWRDWG
jgi:uncharacterized membrane protein YsdA (DUF1294 family)